MKISQDLRHRIVYEHMSTKTFVPETPLPKFPTNSEILDLILRSNPYMRTAKPKWALLELTNEIYDNVNDKSITLPQEIPLMKSGAILITSDLKIEGADIMQLSATKNSDYTRHYNELRALKNQFQNSTMREVRQYDTLRSLLNSHPQLEKLECITAAIAHEKRVRAAAKERRKTEVLEPIVLKNKANTAIAKARLLGAKFLS